MGHYYTDFACDICGSIRCNCLQIKEEQNNINRSNNLLYQLNNSEEEFINLVSEIITEDLDIYETKRYYFWNQSTGWASFLFPFLDNN